MIPLWFPTLVIVPAFVLDLLRLKMGAQWISWKSAVLAGIAFVVVFVAVQWPFADFMLSPAARNRVFGTIYFGYSDPANLLYDPYRFAPLDKTHAAFVRGMAMAVLASIIFSLIGMALGKWMRKVRR
jgi:hypothetical protein